MDDVWLVDIYSKLYVLVVTSTFNIFSMAQTTIEYVYSTHAFLDVAHRHRFKFQTDFAATWRVCRSSVRWLCPLINKVIVANQLE